MLSGAKSDSPRLGQRPRVIRMVLEGDAEQKWRRGCSLNNVSFQTLTQGPSLAVTTGLVVVFPSIDSLITAI